MAVTFTTATEPRLLDTAARDRAEAFEQRAHALLAPLLKSADATPNLRAVLQTLTGATLALKEEHSSVAAILSDIGRRLADVERVQREGKDN